MSRPSVPAPSNRRRAPRARAFAGDEAGAFQVFEAVMVAVLVFTAILFFTGIGRPTGTSEPGGINLAQNAADILDILETRDFGADKDGDGDIDIQDWATSLAQGDPAVLADVDDIIAEIIPSGALYSLRLSNGHGTLALAPGTERVPHGARVAETLLLPNWNALAGNLAAATATSPGAWVDGGALDPWTDASANAVRCIKGPMGDRAGAAGIGPRGVSWVSVWQEDPGRVPDGIPYGLWAGYSDAACTGLVGYAHVGLPGKAALDPLFPVYGVQLAVWFGA